MTEKFCRDCVHMRRIRSWVDYVMYPISSFTDGRRWTCHRLTAERSRGPVDPVTGKHKKLRYIAPACNLERDYDCGKDGKFWKPKDTKKHLFTLLKDSG